MKYVCHELGQVGTDGENRGLDELSKDADRLVANLTVKVRYFAVPLRACYVVEYISGLSPGAVLYRLRQHSTLDLLANPQDHANMS